MTRLTIRNLILATLFLISMIGGFLFMLSRISAEGTLLREQVAAMNAEQAQRDALNRLERMADESTDDRASLVSHFLQQESDSINFLNQIESLAPSAGVSLQTDSLQKITDPETSSTWIEVGFTFSGSKENVQKFVSVLEHVPYLSHITSLKLAARSSTNWQARVTMRVYVLSYDK